MRGTHYFTRAASAVKQRIELIGELLNNGRKALTALHESEEQSSIFADSISQLAWMAKADGWIFWYNQRWYDYTGTSPQQMEGWGWQSVHDPEALPVLLEQWRCSIATIRDDISVVRRDGIFRPFLTRVLPF